MPSPRYYSALAGLNMNEDFVREQSLIDQYVGNQLWSWGHNGAGELGDNTRTHRSSPIQTVSGGNSWQKITNGWDSVLAIKNDGSLWGWGNNASGQLGDNSALHRSSPVQTIAGGKNWKKVSIYLYHVGAIKDNGTLWVWGNNASGQLGNNTDVTNRSSPVQTVSATNNWQEVSCGSNFIAAIKTDGTLWVWGKNHVGQMGDGTNNIHRSSPVQTVAGGNNWKVVAAGGYHMGAIKDDGTLWMWGFNPNGQLGDNTQAHKSSPVQTIAGGNNWKELACGTEHTLSIKTDGTLWVWGRNHTGYLGTGSIGLQSSPIQTIAGGTNWKIVEAGHYISSAIKTDGTLWTWGENTYGQLGDNSRTHRSSPVQTIAGGNNWKTVSSGSEITTALTFMES
jgi:alpha-tubulin suppressor-like RCC1 family protein